MYKKKNLSSCKKTTKGFAVSLRQRGRETRLFVPHESKYARNVLLRSVQSLPIGCGQWTKPLCPLPVNEAVLVLTL